MTRQPLSQRTLRAMKNRWIADLARLEAAYPIHNWEDSDPELETIRNLATAIAEIDGIIANGLRFPTPRRGAA